jgi:hypothetical protein
MYYEINLALNGRHLFATAKRSITSQPELKKVCKIFVEKFPQSEGYNISITEYEEDGYSLDIIEVLNED